MIVFQGSLCENGRNIILAAPLKEGRQSGGEEGEINLFTIFTILIYDIYLRYLFTIFTKVLYRINIFTASLLGEIDIPPHVHNVRYIGGGYNTSCVCDRVYDACEIDNIYH